MPDFVVGTAFKGSTNLGPVFRKMTVGVDKFGRAGVRAMRKVGRAMKKMTGPFKNMLPMLGVGGIGFGLKKIVDSARMIEDAQAAFTPLIGGAKKAKEMVDKLNETAASTPFQFKTLAGAASQLLPVMDGNIKNTIKTIRMLGDTAGGNAQKLESITRGFTKAMLKGKVDMESLNMIAEAGVPVFTEMAESMGFSKDQMSLFFKKISTGKVKTEELVKVFEKMTSKGGLFFKGMIIASKTTSGVISTAKDNITLFAASIGKELLPYVKEIAIAITGAAKSGVDWVKANKEAIGTVVKVIVEVIKYLPQIIAGYVALVGVSRAYIATLKAVAFWQKVIQAGGFIKWIKSLKIVTIAIKIATAAWAVIQKIINVVMAANPIGLIVVAVAALIAGIIALVQNWEEVKKSLGDSTWGKGLLFVLEVIAEAIKEVKNAFSTLGDLLEGDFASAQRKALKSGVHGAMLKSEATSKGLTVDQLLDQKLGAPNKEKLEAQKVSLDGNININGAPKGSTADMKTRGAKPINMQLVGEQ